jgi:hypothetical protein
MGNEFQQKPIWQPVGPRETLEESLRGRTWLLEVRDEPGELVVRDEPGELVVRVSRWSPAILQEIPEWWDEIRVRVELQSPGKLGHTPAGGRPK